MKIGRQFNSFSLTEYHSFIKDHKQYEDFNTLGLYRSILENNELSLEEKIEVRDYAHKFFKKQFDFLQLKDPYTFIEISKLGLELTDADVSRMWHDVRDYQQKLLAEKRIKHRNFGNYSKHNCGYDYCNFNGLMIKQGSFLAENSMHFDTDKPKYPARQRAERRSKDRREQKKIIENNLGLD